MANWYLYRIYDTKSEERLPGFYYKEEICKKLGVQGSVSEWAKNHTLLKKRYKVEIAGERATTSENFAKEWDKARMKLLRAGGK